MSFITQDIENMLGEKINVGLANYHNYNGLGFVNNTSKCLGELCNYSTYKNSDLQMGKSIKSLLFKLVSLAAAGKDMRKERE